MKKMFHMINDLVHRPSVRWSLVALFVYTLTTLVMMYPVPFQLNSVIAGKEYGDAYQYTWSLWWAKQAMLDPDKDLAHITLINHPVGVEHPFMLTMIGVELLALPFSMLLTPAAAYNSQVLLSFILSGMSMYWLGIELTGNRKAGLVGGFIFAFFLNKTGHVLAGHLPQVTVYWLPLYVLFLRRTIQRPGWDTALIAALVLIPTCLIHVMHLAYFVLPVTVAMLFLALMEMRGAFFTWRRLGSLVFVFGLAALATAPLMLPTVLISAGGAGGYLYKVGIIKNSVDLLAFFTPSPYHPVLSSLGLVPSFAKQVFSERGFLHEGLAYPGVLAAGLALWGLVRRGRQVWLWGVLVLLTAVLSLGPLLKVGGKLVLYQVEMYRSYVVLPYALLKQMPMLQVGRTPGRLNETMMFAVAILASYGVAELSSLLARRPRFLAALLALLLIGVGFEYVAIWPFPAGTAEIPPTVHQIASEPGTGAVLHLPITQWREVGKQALYYQTATQRPIVHGYAHRITPETPPWSETLLGLAQPDQADGDIIPRPDSTERTAWLRYFDVDYVVSHEIEPEASANFYRNFVETLLGPPRYEDFALTAFPVSSDVATPGSFRLYTLSRQGWHPPKWDEGLWRRWVSDDGRLYLYSRREEAGSLRFTVDSHLEFPVLEVYAGEQLLDSYVVDEHITYTTRPFTLTQGMNVLRFYAPGGCPLPCAPEAVGTPCHIFAFDHVSFVPLGDLSAGEELDINFGDQMRLRGWRLDATESHPGGVLNVTLSWEATAELSDQHVVFLHLLSPDGRLVAQHDAPPVGPLLPSPAWPPETVFGYPVAIELPDDLPADDYRLLVGVYLRSSLERLPVLADVPGAEINVVELESVRIETPGTDDE